LNRANEEEMQARFAKNFWWFRTQRRLSQEALSFRCEIHRTQLTLIENSKRSSKVPTLLALAGGLELPIERLFDGIRFQPPEPGRSGHYVVEPLTVPGLGEIP
jgi:transcriptional regulator with XRE-family HTH domain